MEVVAVSQALPALHNVNGLEIKTSIIHIPKKSPSDYIELNENGIVGNATAVHDGPVYICLAENYEYWCTELGINRSEWDWCHWGENITFKCTDQVLTEADFRLGDVWRVGDTVRLQVCGSRVPCMKLSWRCGQKDSWLKTLSDTGRVGVYLRVLKGGRIYPGDYAFQESSSGDEMDVATITRLAFDSDLKTRDTLDLLANHEVLLGLNRQIIRRKIAGMDDKANMGRNAWKGWRDLIVSRVVDQGNHVKSFHLYPTDDKELSWYLPGQFLTVRLPTGDVRSWSISDWPGREQPQYYRLTIKRGANASAWMFENCLPGTILSVRSPAGRFFLDWAQALPLRQVYLSAGIGATPILSMMKAHASHPNMSRISGIWIHVARDGRGLQLHDEFFRIENNPIRRIVFMTQPREVDTAEKNYDFKGRPSLETLTELMGGTYKANPFGTAEMDLPAKFSAVYICGPQDFEKDAKGILSNLQIPPPFIHSENFSASGKVVGDLARAKVRFTKSNKTVQWEKDKPMSLLELAESVGMTPDFGCRVGACGSCAAKVTCGSVTGGAQMDGSILTCSATPASEEIHVEL
ncbi:putative flavodoxin reductase family protein [Fusarium austroafricanum]|uniref:Putative flavodoxin reductase family protein n=1 Tax=Fusarium austroafricanum TaxID=2364996 RepID=A0A8H4KIZ8_9HYPO|nr:putative flavodoxin reductase family protein [Fusarium austroafricanum]